MLFFLLLISLGSASIVTEEQCVEIRATAEYWKPYENAHYHDADAIIPGLYVGNVCAAHNKSWLLLHRIVMVISVAREWDTLPYDIAAFRHLVLDDVVEQDEERAMAVIEQAVALIRGTEVGGVLVHCNMGISRSATVVLAYLARYRWPNMSFVKILRRMRLARPVVRPNQLFARLLTKHEL